ncbi:chromophore lyase CpcT/CpeT [Stenomitos frigidus]|uniref:Chromophore lyase CpcT/CpeT n=1 Tax=Stenomitos frigidus ULC18 TaxID=2107698 RepID=A0A2T1E168_9CYAN|nr:chromophore lyase CpcT/CpeT [Stenomitos frigidus]PSB26498.1 chorismate mutase [Stenomitos frigidus ULC18]
MPLDPTLVTLARYMAGEFDNREQAIADPVWYVHLRFWQRPVPLFSEDSLTLFAEQASVINLDQPYRQRIIRLMQRNDVAAPVQVQYYGLKDPTAAQGAGLKPEFLQALTLDHLESLPGCRLQVTHHLEPHSIVASPMPGSQCFFSYQGRKAQVQLGFAAYPDRFESHDKGIDIETQKATWGAVMGPYRYTKRRDFAAEFAIVGES